MGPKQFFWVVGGERKGPVGPEEFARLVASGEVGDETLMFNEALTEWRRYGEYRSLAVAGFAKCAVTGRLGLVAEMVKYEDLYICADQKEVFFQRLKEGLGVAAGDDVRDPEKLRRRLDESGYPITAGAIISGSVDAWKTNFWMSVGAVLVASVLNGIVGSVPILGVVAVVLFQPHILAGASLVLLRRVRGETASLTGLFEPLSKQYGAFALYGLITVGAYLPIILLTGVAVAMMAPAIQRIGPESGDPRFVMALLPVIGLAALLSAFVYVRLLLAPLLMADKGVPAWEAVKLSWKATGMRFWSLLGGVFVTGLIAALGILGLGIGILLTMPLTVFAGVIAYERAFGRRHA